MAPMTLRAVGTATAPKRPDTAAINHTYGISGVLTTIHLFDGEFGVRAVRLVPIDPARAALLDQWVGSIEVGKDADLVINASSLLDPTAPVGMVLVDGKLAYRRDRGN